MSLRPYQVEAVEAALAWIKQSIDPCVIEAATGAGKSHIIATIAQRMHTLSGGKHVLCVAPSKELVIQNRKKFLATGAPASLYSASAGMKCLQHPVVFATPGTFIKVARRLGVKFCAVIVDEAHGITPTVQKIIADMREGNRHLRVIGTTATPSRMGTGYIYREDEHGKLNGPDVCRDPYFVRKVYTIKAHELLRDGYLTPPLIGETGAENYDTSNLVLNSRNQFDPTDIDRAFVGHGRKTAAIVADVIQRSRGRDGVMLFAATVQHAKEVMASLPPDMSEMVDGTTPGTIRDSIIARFIDNKVRYLVSVGTLTTGFDAPHVGVIALLRAMESVELMQQIIGRGMRLHPSKKDFLVLDYGSNVERHCPDGDIFRPQIKASKAPGANGVVNVKCPACDAALEFGARENDGLFQIDANGYFTLEGERVMTEFGPSPAHFGRRCYGLVKGALGVFSQCGYRWTSKPCPHCEADNDIAARYCKECRGEIIDPNEKLVMDFKALKKDPTRTQTDLVVSMVSSEGISRSGNRTLRVDFETPHRNFSVWYSPNGPHFAHREYAKFMDATMGGIATPKTVTYRKDEDSKFYRILSFNLKEDEVGELV
jgi:DNA repair protein RadD